MLLMFLVLFMFFFSVGLGAITFVVASEIFPLAVRVSPCCIPFAMDAHVDVETIYATVLTCYFSPAATHQGKAMALTVFLNRLLRYDATLMRPFLCSGQLIILTMNSSFLLGVLVTNSGLVALTFVSLSNAITYGGTFLVYTFVSLFSILFYECFLPDTKVISLTANPPS